MRPVCGRREVAKGPRCARSAFPARTLTRGCQAAARLLRSAAALRVTAAGERAGSPCGPAGRLALIQQNEAQQHRGAAPLSRTTAAADARGARTERTGQAPSPALDLEKAGTTAAWAVTARRRPVCERFRSYSARRPGGAVRGRGPAAGLRNAGASWSHGGASPRPRGGESHALTTLLRRLLGVTQLYVERVQFPAAGRLSVAVRPSWRRSRCGTCGRRAPRYDRRPERCWRHLPWGPATVWPRYAPWRVSCRHCGVRVEQVSWAASGSAFTASCEEMVAYLAQTMDRTAVSRLTGISWQAVGSIVERVVARQLDPGRFTG